jgi:hypothetical protein
VVDVPTVRNLLPGREARQDRAKNDGVFRCALERLLHCASDLSTRRQGKGHAVVTTGTEDQGSILESGPERLLILLRKAAGAQRSHWAMPEGVRGHMNDCPMGDQFKWVCCK